MIAIAGFTVVAVVLWLPHTWVPVPAPPPPRAAAPAPPPAAPPPAPEAELLIRATLSAPESIKFGESLTFHWTGPDNPTDFVTLVRPDAPADKYGMKRPTKAGWKLAFPAPAENGLWELRYVAGRSRKVLGQTVVTVRAPTAEITAPDQAILGTQIVVNWTGPNRPGDCLTIVARDTPDGKFESIVSVGNGQPVAMTVPSEPGDAEIRYMTNDHQVIGRHAFTVTIPITTLFAQDEVEEGATFEVRWNGPNNPDDVIALVSPQTTPATRHDAAPTMNGSPISLRAPRKSGRAELRYVASPKGLVFARRPIQIVPAR